MTTLVQAATCRNCGARLQGRFCAACGQEDLPLDPSISQVVGEVARELSDLDGRILQSVRRLFFSPGFLTKEHFEGRRVGWVSPVRLYLLFSVCYFAITAFIDAAPVNVDLRATGDDSEVASAIRGMGFGSIAEMQRALKQALATWFPRAMFVLVPVFAWLVSRVRRRSGRKYPHHVIFACHAFAVFFGAQSAAIAVGYLSGNTAIDATLRAAAGLYAGVYLVVSMKAVYGGTLGRALAHTAVVLAFYWLATILAVAAILLPLLYHG